MLKRIILRSLLGIIFVVTSIVLIFVVANWQDQALRPEVQASLDWKAPQHIEDDNGYLILLGINAKNGFDPLSVGKRKLELDLIRYERQPNSSEYESEEESFKKSDDEVCEYAKTVNCVDFYISRSLEREQEIIESRRVLSEHLNLILTSKDFTEIAPPFIAASIPPYSALVHAMEIERMRAIRLIANGQSEQGMAALMKIAAFSQRWLENSTFLISHMIALSAVQRDLRIIDELLQRFPILNNQYAAIKTWVEGFSEKKMSISRALNFESRISLRIMHDLRLESGDPQNSWLQGFLFNLLNRPNAGLNLAYDWQQIWSALANQSGRDYLLKKNEVKAKQEALLGFGFSNIYLRDPVTKVLLDVSTPGYEAYIEKHIDTFAQIHLFATKMELLVGKVPLSAIPQAVQDLAKRYPNPYDGKPVGWDAKKNQLFIQLFQESNQRYQKSKDLRLDVSSSSAVET